MTPTHDPTPIEYQDSITGGLYSLKSSLTDAVVKADRLIERSLAITPKLPDKTVTPPGGVPKLAGVLFLAGLASLCVSAGPPHTSEVRPVTATLSRPGPSPSMLAGTAAQFRGDYRDALGHYQDAGTRGAVPECYLPPIIEVYINTQQYGLAGMMLAKLANANPRDESLVPYYQAAILYAGGKTNLARPYYLDAEKKGHPGAAEVLDHIGRE